MFSAMIQVFAVVIWTFATFFVSWIELYESRDVPRLMIGRNEFIARCRGKPFTASWFSFRFRFSVAVFFTEAEFYFQGELFGFPGAFCSLVFHYFPLFCMVSLSKVSWNELFRFKRSIWMFQNGPFWPTFHWKLLFWRVSHLSLTLQAGSQGWSSITSVCSGSIFSSFLLNLRWVLNIRSCYTSLCPFQLGQMCEFSWQFPWY